LECGEDRRFGIFRWLAGHDVKPRGGREKNTKAAILAALQIEMK
jgi:hypothetical protein